MKYIPNYQIIKYILGNNVDIYRKLSEVSLQISVNSRYYHNENINK